MTDRRKTGLILGLSSIFMFSPLALSLFWRPIPLFQNLGFTRETLAPPLAWILATITAAAYVFYTMKAIPFVFAQQKEISLFKLLGILSAVAGGIVEEVFFRRWLMDISMSGGLNPFFQVILSGVAFGFAHTSWTLLTKRNFRATLPAILSTSILGIMLAIIYLVGGRNLGPCIAAHVLIDMIIEPWLMLSAVAGLWRLPRTGYTPSYRPQAVE